MRYRLAFTIAATPPFLQCDYASSNYEFVRRGAAETARTTVEGKWWNKHH